jgi:hypothetical protein
MSDDPKDKDLDETKRIMGRLVKTAPDPGRKSRSSERDQKKPGGNPAKNDRPEATSRKG